MKPDLSVDFLGIKLPNPFLISSVPSTTVAGFHKAAKFGWGGGVMWGGELTGDGRAFNRGYIPRDIEFVGKPPKWWAYQNSAYMEGNLNPEQYVPVEKTERLIREAKKSGMIIGCNIMESWDPEAWARVGAAAERGGADFLELNWSCPYIPGTGLNIGIDSQARLSVMKAVRKQCRLPVMVKLTASLERDMLSVVARGAEEAGADAISITNTFSGIIGVDIETGMPLACEQDMEGNLRGMSGGISGPFLKPMGLRGVAEIRRAVKLPISAIGGVTEWQSAVEYMLVGASTVQIGTAVMFFGYRLINKLTKGLEEYMERKGYRNIKDFVGMTSDKYFLGEGWIPTAVKQPRKMVVDEERCTGCGLCAIACDASSSESEALKIVAGIAKIDPELCHNCNTCRIVCPEGAISAKWEVPV